MSLHVFELRGKSVEKMDENPKSYVIVEDFQAILKALLFFY